jgi:hypothetical protein
MAQHSGRLQLTLRELKSWDDPLSLSGIYLLVLLELLRLWDLLVADSYKTCC